MSDDVEECGAASFARVQSCMAAVLFEASPEEDLSMYLGRLSTACEPYLEHIDETSPHQAKTLVPYYRALLATLSGKFKRDLLTLLNLLLTALDDSAVVLPVTLRLLSKLRLWLPLEPEIRRIMKQAARKMVDVHEDSYHALAEILETRLQRSIAVPLGLSPLLESRWRSLLLRSLRDEFLSSRAARIFDHVLDDPEDDSLPRLLSEAFYPGCLRLVSQTLESTYLKRLMYSAAEMPDVVAQLVMSVEAVRRLDASGYLLDSLLLSFRDLIRENPQGLASVLGLFIELAEDAAYKSHLAQGGELKFDAEGGLYFGALPESWVPDPPEASDRTVPPSGTAFMVLGIVRQSSKMGSIFCILLNFFENAEEFIEEYRKRLSSLLISFSVDFPKLIAEVEMLKSKVTSASWSSCEVMIRDYEESRKLLGTGQPGLILSHLYWPIEPEPVISRDIPQGETSVEKMFMQAHQHQRLRWRLDLARMIVEVPSSGGTREIDCLEVQGRILLWMSDREKPVSLEEIQTALSEMCSAEEIEAGVLYWVRKRVVECRGEFFNVATSWDPELPEFPDVVLQEATLVGLGSAGLHNNGHRPEYLDLLKKLQSCAPDGQGVRREDVRSVLQRFAIGHEWDEEHLDFYLQARIEEGYLVPLPDSGTFLVRSAPMPGRLTSQ